MIADGLRLYLSIHAACHVLVIYVGRSLWVTENAYLWIYSSVYNIWGILQDTDKAKIKINSLVVPINDSLVTRFRPWQQKCKEDKKDSDIFFIQSFVKLVNRFISY